METNDFGLHQTFDCYNCPEEILDNFEFLKKFLDGLPARINMTKISEPFIIRHAGGTPKDPGGLTGFIMIAESHISIHTFPKLGFFTMDVYSCNPFDTKLVRDIVKEDFKVGIMEENLLNRGLRFKELALSKWKPEVKETA